MVGGRPGVEKKNIDKGAAALVIKGWRKSVSETVCLEGDLTRSACGARGTMSTRFHHQTEGYSQWHRGLNFQPCPGRTCRVDAERRGGRGTFMKTPCVAGTCEYALFLRVVAERVPTAVLSTRARVLDSNDFRAWLTELAEKSKGGGHARAVFLSNWRS